MGGGGKLQTARASEFGWGKSRGNSPANSGLCILIPVEPERVCYKFIKSVIYINLGAFDSRIKEIR